MLGIFFPIAGVYGCLGVFMGVVNTVGFRSYSDLFLFDPLRRGVLRFLLKKKEKGENLIGHGKDGGVSGVLYLPKSID
jgi:hypothetical protein